MTKKDYQKIASIIKDRIEYNTNFQDDAISELHAIANKMAVVFQIDNPRFNREKFLIACGVISGAK